MSFLSALPIFVSCRPKLYLSYQNIIIIWEDIIPYTLGGCDCSVARIESKISKINLLGTFVVDARMQLCDTNCIQKSLLSIIHLLLFYSIVVRNLK
ncbi:hypothetical protein MN116_007236 [Schistosoma mekongi]|uniref:Uncharacterized protein n=1 Tax=Schistosoma mekongi TaxID=38744 RepID=A0AAE1Z9G2_SCHME|nr:hypothetical protein MN116_007236 [Schistosoma mekongi]